MCETTSDAVCVCDVRVAARRMRVAVCVCVHSHGGASLHEHAYAAYGPWGLGQDLDTLWGDVITELVWRVRSGVLARAAVVYRLV